MIRTFGRTRGVTRSALVTAATAAVVIAGTAQPAHAATVSIPVGAQVGAFGWGWNINGQVGDGSLLDRGSPVQIAAENVKQVASGYNFGVSLMTDGTVRWWGGESGVSAPTPSVPGNLTGIVQVAAGREHVLAVGAGGSVWAWGHNHYGQRGYGYSDEFSAVGQQVTSVGTGFIRVAAGSTHSLAVRSNGTVVAWGANTSGQLGDGTTQYRSNPVQVSGLTGVTDVAAGDGFSLARRSDGTIWAWGYNGTGQLGIGSRTAQYLPVQVPGLTGVTRIAAGSAHSLAVAGTNDSVWTWGNNLASSGYSLSPASVGLTGVAQIAAGQYTSAAVLSNGTLWTWGYDLHGALALGTVSDIGQTVSTPTQVTGVPKSVQVSLAGNSGLAVGVTSATMPNVVGLSQLAANHAVSAAGLVVGQTKLVADCDNVGIVVSQNPAGGTRLPLGSTVTITVGKLPSTPCQ